MIGSIDRNKDVDHVLFSEKQIDEITTRLAKEIDDAYRNKEGKLLLVGILKGSVMFMTDLVKKISLPLEIDFMRVSSYAGGTKSTGKVNIILDLHRKDLSECNILVVEDIIDSGHTLSFLIDYLKLSGAKGVETCTFLDKPSRREVEFEADYVGAQIPNEFVVGYGLDYDEKYRELPYVGILRPEVYE